MPKTMGHHRNTASVFVIPRCVAVTRYLEKESLQRLTVQVYSSPS